MSIETCVIKILQLLIAIQFNTRKSRNHGIVMPPISETVNGSLRSNSKKISLSSKGEITDRIVTTSQRWIIATSHPLSTSDWHHLRRHCRDTDNGRARHWHRFAYYDSSLHNLRVGRDDIRRDATLWTVLSYPSGIL